MIESTHHLLWIFVMVFFRCICTYGTTIRAPPTTSFCFPPLYCQLSLQPQVLSYKIFYVYCVQIFFICHFFFWFNMDVLDIYLFQMSWVFISFFWWCVRLNSFFKMNYYGYRFFCVVMCVCKIEIILNLLFSIVKLRNWGASLVLENVFVVHVCWLTKASNVK